ncbi:MAG: class I SAM-dependent methyltransferase [archaeon]|jgi:ubiquinone/menaquinone biosynthesis C-methylase UbiE
MQKKALMKLKGRKTNTPQRNALAVRLKEARRLDRNSLSPTLEKPGYGVSFNAHVNQLRYYYQRDFVGSIEHHRLQNPKNYRVLEVGCGGGKAANELKGNIFRIIGGKIKVTATGTRRLPVWEQYAKNVDFHVAHAENLSHVFAPNSFNFIHSNLGIGNTKNPKKALFECHKLLRKNGRLLFTSEIPVVIPRKLYKKIEVKRVKIKVYDQFEVLLNVYYLEKI